MELNFLGGPRLHENSSLRNVGTDALDLTSTPCFNEERAMLVALISLVAFATIGICIGLSRTVNSASLIHYGIPTGVLLTGGLSGIAGVDKKAIAIAPPLPPPEDKKAIPSQAPRGSPSPQVEAGSEGRPYDGL